MPQKIKTRGPNGGEDYRNSGHGDPRTEESDSTRNRHGNVSEHETTNGNNRELRSSGNAELLPEMHLGEYTQATKETIHSMQATHRTLKNLTDQYARHFKDIEDIAETRRNYENLLEQCKYKDSRIDRQKITIKTLREESREQEEMHALESQRLVKERSELEAERLCVTKDKETERVRVAKEKETAAKRRVVQDAELKLYSENKLERLKTELEQQFSDRKKNLEADFRTQKENNQKQLVDLEGNNLLLEEKLKEYQQQLQAEGEKLAAVKENYDDQEMVKNSLKGETRSLKAKLKRMENEFDLTTNTIPFYKAKFLSICKGIEHISLKYFRDLSNEKTAHVIHKELMSRKINFASIPISNSEESQTLRMALAQHVICSSFCEILWQPFSAEKTTLHPELASLLGEISTTLAASQLEGSFGRRSARIWSALTMRALQTLSATPAHPQNPTEQMPPPHHSAEIVVDKVLSALFPLIIQSQENALRNDLSVLAQSAQSVWYSAQTDEVQVIICPSLDQGSREEWRSLMLDPMSSPPKNDELGPDVDSSTQSHVFTLFPRIIASKVSEVEEPSANSLPGGWPNPHQELDIVETCIHTGMGLPEWSLLVEKGKEEIEDTKTRLYEEHIQEEMMRLDSQRRELEARSGRNGKLSRRDTTERPTSAILTV